jgi:hypothetical protein
LEALVTPPVLVVDREGWIWIFVDVEEAERELESPDVEAAEYLGFDGAGRRLMFLVGQVPAGLGWWQKIRTQAPVAIRASVDPPRPAVLSRLLHEALGKKEPTGPDDAPELARLVIDAFGASRARTLRAPVSAAALSQEFRAGSSRDI